MNLVRTPTSVASQAPDRAEAVVPPLPPGPTTRRPLIPDHELLRCIGRGSYGEVWLARNVLGTLRAVKIVRRAAFEEDKPFQREFHGIQKFEPISRSHEGLVGILQVGANEAEGCFYYVMELADDANDESRVSNVESTRTRPADTRSHPMGEGRGEGSASFGIRNSEFYIPKTLRTDIKRRGPLPPNECIAIALTLTRALVHLHAHKLVHRDIKPSNIIFIGGAPRLADIGLVTDLDATRTYVGTEGFMPPEGPGTPQADLYALGKVLYEMATGKDRQEFPDLPTALGVTPHPSLSPPRGEGARRAGEGCASADPQSATSIARAPDRNALLELNEIFTKACATDPRQRYQGAAELQTDLAFLQRGDSVRRKRATQQRWTIVRKWGIASVVSAVLIAAVWPSLFGNRDRSPNPEAVRLFELGRWHHNRYTDEARAKAIEYLNQAVQIDSNYVDAYGLLFHLYVWHNDSEVKWRKNRELADRLMALAPKRAEAHSALSWARYGESDWQGAEREIQTAIKLNPDYPVARCIYGYYLALRGRVEEAKPELRRAEELDPTSRLNGIVAAFPFIVARQYDEAMTQLRKPLSLDPHFPLAHQWLARIYEAKGDYLSAISEHETLARFTGADEGQVVREREALRQAFRQSGPHGYWLKALDLQQTPDSLLARRAKSWGNRHDLAEIYAQLGETEKALDYLEKDFVPEGPGSWLKLLPLYEPLRGEPRFKALLKRAGLDG